MLGTEEGGRSHSPSHVRIFIGEPIRYESEREVLHFIYEYLEQRTEWAVLLANFNIAGTQLDLLVATESNTLVVEAKRYSLPVRGGINGPWELSAPGRPKFTRNAYGQALAAKNALRDHMSHYVPEIGYPDAVVCIPKGLPSGSELPGSDFKVGIGALDELLTRINLNRGCKCAAGVWEQLIGGLRLQEVRDVDAAISEDIFNAQVTLDRYRDAFLAFYDSGERYVPDEYRLGDELITFRHLDEMIGQYQSVLIQGPSGCGKSLVARKFAAAHACRGGVPVFLSAKEFDGALRHSLESEIALLGTASSAALLRAVRITDAPILLVVDGCNECDESSAAALTRGVAAFALRYGASVLATSQVALARADLLPMTAVGVQYPSSAMKQELAGLSASDGSVAGELNLLESVSSGLEAVLVGKVGGSISGSSSRFALYDAYVRLRLGDRAYDGIRCLCALARLLIRRASFRVSVREFDRILGEERVSRPAAQKMESTNLLQRRGDHVSFGHELFFAAFAAETAVRDAGENSDHLIEALASPRYLASRTLIVGAIEDQRQLTTVLEACRDAHIYLACSKGECGQEPRRWVLQRLQALISKMISEAQHLRFELGDAGWHGAHVCADSIAFLPDEMSLFLPAIAHGLSRGEFVRETLVAIRHVDAAMAASIPLLASEARDKKIPLRSAMFADAYVWSRLAGISQLIYSLHSGGLFFLREPNASSKSVLMDAWAQARTPGEFYFLISLTKHTGQAPWAAPYVVPLVKDIKRLPYHLQLDVLDFSHYLREVEEPWLSQLIDGLQSSLDQLGVMMNSLIFEALRALGALEEPEYAHQEVVKAEIAEVLASNGEEAEQRAYGIFSCQFDHPFESAYWEVILDLPPTEKRTFLKMAARGAAEPHTFFLSMLIRQLTEYPGADVAEAIAPWTKLPPQKSFMPQNSMEVFFEAHASLGVLGASLPSARGDAETPAAEALLACGELTYWASRQKPTSNEATRAKGILLRDGSIAAAGALLSTVSHMLDRDGKRNSLVDAYPDLALSVCRKALTDRDAQVGFYEHAFSDGSYKIADFCLQVIGRYGDHVDVPVLRELCDARGLGETALHAIRQIEDRAFGSP